MSTPGPSLRLKMPIIAPRSSSLRLRPALRIALVYAIISLSYIILSDMLVEQSFTDSQFRLIQTLKGALFVSLSAIVIYFLIRAELKKQDRLREIALRSQRLEAIGQLAIVMAHDFNNVLTVVIGALEMIEDTLPPDHPALVHLTTAISAADRAGRLTHRMLVYSRQGQLPPRPVDVNQCAQEMIPLLNLAIGEQISLRLDLADGLPPVNAEPCKFENILLNLIINSRDSMLKGGEVVLETGRERIDTQLTDGAWTVPPGDYVTVLVRDTGHGMSKQVMAQVLTSLIHRAAA